MAAQFVPAPGAGQAPFAARPNTPRGLYRTFGAPESLLSIHFPTNPNDQKNTSNPWYWYLDFQQPYAFSFLFTKWVRLPSFTVIKILAIDTQPIVPIPPVGAKTLEQAMSGNPDVTFGRIDFKDQRFWTLLGKPKPKFNETRGKITAAAAGQDINGQIKSAAQLYQNDWNGEAATYNRIAAGVGGGGFHYPGQPSLFAIPLPDGPPTTISRFQQQLDGFLTTPPGPGAAFLGPVPASAFFNINTFTTQAYAFTLKVGQLDPKKWNMSVFPPVPTASIGNGSPSQQSDNYSGFGATPFLVAGPNLV
jgi:hypothetical protein